MPRLIHLNGLPGTGKSTLAEYHVERHPLSMNLDVDVVRGLIGGWATRPVPAGLLARRMVLAAAQEALGEGHDVVVPQFLGRTDFLLAMAELATACAAAFVPMVLLEPPERTVERLRERAAGPMTPAQRDAHRFLDLDTLPELHRRLLDVVASRPDTAAVGPVVGDLAATHRALLALLPD